MASLTKGEKDYLEARIADAQFQLEDIKKRIDRVQSDVLNPLRTLLLKSLGKTE
jgi:hypothetical protein